MNAMANDTFTPLGVPIWHDPALLTLSALAGCFSDAFHHDACTLLSSRSQYAKKVASECEWTRFTGHAGIPTFHIPRSIHFPYKGWADSGGLSESETRRLIHFVWPEGEPVKCERRHHHQVGRSTSHVYSSCGTWSAP